LIDPEDDGCRDAYGGHEGMGASVVAGVDASPVLEPAEHDLDTMAPMIEPYRSGGGRLAAAGVKWMLCS
jgi:hypothetical protein